MLWLFSMHLSLWLNYGVVLQKSMNITKSSNVQINVHFWTGRLWPLMAHKKFTVTTFSLAKIFVTITFKNRIFSCFKISSDNGVLDIYWKVAALLLFDNTGLVFLLFIHFSHLFIFKPWKMARKWLERMAATILNARFWTEYFWLLSGWNEVIAGFISGDYVN